MRTGSTSISVASALPTYRLMVEAKGFRSSRQMDIVLLADQTLTLNFRNVLGDNPLKTVTVVGNALQVDTVHLPR